MGQWRRVDRDRMDGGSYRREEWKYADRDGVEKLIHSCRHRQADRHVEK